MRKNNLNRPKIIKQSVPIKLYSNTALIAACLAKDNVYGFGCGSRSAVSKSWFESLVLESASRGCGIRQSWKLTESPVKFKQDSSSSSVLNLAEYIYYGVLALVVALVVQYQNHGLSH